MVVTKEEWYILHKDHRCKDLKFWPYEKHPDSDEIKRLEDAALLETRQEVVERLKSRERALRKG